MMENRLTSIADHSDYLSASTYSDSEKWQLHRKHVKFVKQHLEPWMFIPCDKDGNVLEEPKDDELCKYCSYDESKRGASAFSLGCEGSRCDSAADDFIDIFEEAKYRVLFKGLVIEKFMHKQTKQTVYEINNMRVGISLEFHDGRKEFVFQITHDNYIIEDLVKYDLELTPTALKQIGYE